MRVDGYHEILIAGSGSWVKSARVICEESVDRNIMQIDSWLLLCGTETSLRGVHGSDVLARLRHVAFCGFRCIGAVASSKGCSEAWLCSVSSAFDGRNPGRFDWETRCSMEVRDEGRHTG